MPDEGTAMTGMPDARQRAALRDRGTVVIPLALLRITVETYGPRPPYEAGNWAMAQLMATLRENEGRASSLAEGAIRAGYGRVRDAFEDDPVALAFLATDGRGTLAEGVGAMSAEIAALRSALAVAVDAHRRLEEDIGRVTPGNREAGARILDHAFDAVALRAGVAADAIALPPEPEPEDVPGASGEET